MAEGIRFMENHRVINSVIPVADFIATDVETDEVNMENWNHCTFLVITGANGSADEPKFLVESCSDASASNNTAIAFDYTSTPGPALLSRQDWANYTRKTSAGYQTDTDSAIGLMHCIEVDAAELSSTAGVQHEFVRLLCEESGSTGITGCVITILSEPRFAIDPGNQTSVIS